jgi:uncharacterized protein YceK
MGEIRASTLASVVLAFLSGCGTMTNITGLSMGGHYMEPYGGVRLSVDYGADNWQHVVHPTPDAGRVSSLVGTAYDFGIDLPVSAIGDTLTLPFTLRAALKGESRTGKPLNLCTVPISLDPKDGQATDCSTLR